MSKCLRGEWKWEIKELVFPCPWSPAIRECSWKKTQIEKKNWCKVYRLLFWLLFEFRIFLGLPFSTIFYKMFQQFLQLWDPQKHISMVQYYLLFDHKDFLKSNWCTDFCENNFVFWKSQMITNFEFRIFVIMLNTIVNIRTWRNIERLLIQLINVLIFSYSSQILVARILQSSDKSLSSNTYSVTAWWITFQYHCHGIMMSMIYCTIHYPDLPIPCLVYDQSDVEKSVEKRLFPVRYERYILNLLLLWILLILFFVCFFLNGLKALYVNTGCVRLISDRTWSLFNNYCIHFLYSKSKVSLDNGALNLNWHKDLSLINLDFLLFHKAHFNKSVVFPLLVFETLPF